MALANLDACAQFTFEQEGGAQLSRDPNDPGNWSSGQAGVGHLIGSKYGVSAETLISWMKPAAVTAATMAALTQDTATAIYAARYFQAMGGPGLPGGVELSVVDFGYTAGNGTSVRSLQQLIGADPDGWCGPDTLAAIGQYDPHAGALALSAHAARAVQGWLGVAVDGDVGPITLAAIAGKSSSAAAVLCGALADAQLAHYRSLADWPLYGGGWTNRTWARLDAALALVSA